MSSMYADVYVELFDKARPNLSRHELGRLSILINHAQVESDRLAVMLKLLARVMGDLPKGKKLRQDELINVLDGLSGRADMVYAMLSVGIEATLLEQHLAAVEQSPSDSLVGEVL